MHANPNNTAHTAAAQKAVDTAQMCLANGQLKNALKHFQHAVALMPHVAALHALIGDVFIDMGHPNQAIEKYTNALRLEPKIRHFGTISVTSFATTQNMQRQPKPTEWQYATLPIIPKIWKIWGSAISMKTNPRTRFGA